MTSIAVCGVAYQTLLHQSICSSLLLAQSNREMFASYAYDRPASGQASGPAFVCPVFAVRIYALETIETPEQSLHEL